MSDHLCDSDCDCERIDFVLDHAAIAEYARERFGKDLPLTVMRRRQTRDETTQMWSVRRDCEGWMRYRYTHDGTIQWIRIMLVSAESDLDNPGKLIHKTVRQTLRTLAHEFEHIQQLLHHGPAELKRAYRRERDAFEEEAIKAESKWVELGHLVRPRKRGTR